MARVVRVEIVCQGCYRRMTTKEAAPDGPLTVLWTDEQLIRAGWLITKHVCYCPQCQDHTLGASVRAGAQEAKDE